MSKLFFLTITTFLAAFASAQIKDPVKWTYSAKKINGTTYEVHLTADIEAKWHLYSQTTPDGGPVPTLITFSQNPLLTISGKPKEVGKLQQKHEPLFGVDVKQFSGKVDFVQIVKLIAEVTTTVSGSLEFMVCDDQQCLPTVRKQFSVPLR